MSRTAEDAIAESPRFAPIYEAMRATEMNDWVGGGDPELAAYFSSVAVFERLSIGPASHVLDFGCGIGRVALGLLSAPQRPSRYVGFDIVPALVDFCRQEIAPYCPQTSFELIHGENDHYDRFKEGATPPRSRDALNADYGGSFSHGYAISVFTHLDAEQFQRELRFIASLLQEGGEFMFTAFTLTPHSRRMIPLGSPHFRFDEAEFRENGQVMIGKPQDPLAFIAYDRSLIEHFVEQAGLVISRIDYGKWMGSEHTNLLQDHYVCRKPLSDRGCLGQPLDGQ